MITPLQYPGWRGIGPKRFLLPALLIFAAAGSGWLLWGCSQDGGDAAGTGKAARPVPVEVAPIEEGPIALRRTFSGALEAQAEFVVAPKVSGRVKHVTVNIADTVDLGQIVAELDDDEYVQAVAQARADLAVARANLSEAESALGNCQPRVQPHRVAGTARHCVRFGIRCAQQAMLAKQAQLEVASAQVAKGPGIP
jgi:multidrug efflux pump subunit AcrA (membrane-fusion protein)